MERLAGALAAARSRTPTVVLLEGEPGTGKSTLVGTLLRDGPAIAATASGDACEMILDYGVVDQLVRTLPPNLRARAAGVVHPDPGGPAPPWSSWWRAWTWTGPWSWWWTTPSGPTTRRSRR